MTMIQDEGLYERRSQRDAAEVYLSPPFRDEILAGGREPGLMGAARHAWSLETAQHLCVIAVLAVGALVALPATVAVTGILLLWLFAGMVRRSTACLLVRTGEANRERFLDGNRSKARHAPIDPGPLLGRLILALAGFLLLPLAVSDAAKAPYPAVERGTVLIMTFLLVPVVARGLAIRRALSAGPETVVTRLTAAQQALQRLPVEVFSAWRLVRAFRYLPRRS